MKAQVYWVPGPWPGRLGIVPRPRGGDWLADEIRAWREAGIDVVTSLLTPDEVAELDLSQEAACARAEGLTYVSLPIPDYGVPNNESFTQIARQLDEALTAGRSIAAHCRQGIGRSSLLVAALLVAAGVDEDAAFQRIEEARGRPVPDTQQQREWVAQNAARLIGELRASPAAPLSSRLFGPVQSEVAAPGDFDNPLPEDILALFDGQ